MPESNSSPVVAFIGLGAMGGPMALRLVDAGYQLRCFDIQNSQLRPLIDAGAEGANTPREAALGADISILMVATPDQVEDVVFGTDGIAEAQSSGSIVCIMGTVGVDCVASVVDRLEQRGVLVIDAPVSGGVARAHTGELVIMAGGDPDVFDRMHNVFAILGGVTAHCGERVGDGQAVKLVNQLLAGVHIAAAAEALAFAQAIGLDPEAVFEVVSKGAAGSFMLSDRGQRMITRDFETPKSALDIFVKDMDLVLAEARAKRFPVPLGSVAGSLYLMGKARGLGQMDDSSMLQVYEDWLHEPDSP